MPLALKEGQYRQAAQEVGRRMYATCQEFPRLEFEGLFSASGEDGVTVR